MKKHLIALLALICLAGLGASANAEEGDLVVNVPHEFVVAGKTLPAGKYTISRVFNDPLQLSLTSYDDHTGAIVLPTTLSSVPADHVGLTFATTGDNYVLTGIASTAGVYTIANHPARYAKMAKALKDGGDSSGGTK